MEYGGELDDDDDDQFGDDVPDGLDDDEASKQSNDDVTESTQHVTKGVTSSEDIQSTEISQTDPELAAAQQKGSKYCARVASEVVCWPSN